MKPRRRKVRRDGRESLSERRKDAALGRQILARQYRESVGMTLAQQKQSRHATAKAHRAFTAHQRQQKRVEIAAPLIVTVLGIAALIYAGRSAR